MTFFIIHVLFSLFSCYIEVFSVLCPPAGGGKMTPYARVQALCLLAIKNALFVLLLVI